MESAKDEDITIRLNSNGGSPEDGYGMIAKFKEHTGGKKVKVDGKALSMGLYFCCFADDVEALDVSEFLLHRAAYPEWMEKDSRIMTDEMWASLDRMNAKLRQAFEAKIDVDKFTEIFDVTLDEVFSNDGQVDVYMTAEQAMEIGLIDTIVEITPEIREAVARRDMQVAAYVNKEKLEAAKKKNKPKSNQNQSKMNIDKLKAEHPDVYNEVFEAGKTAEKERVNSLLAWVEADNEQVIKAVKDGTQMTASLQNELAVKLAKLGNLQALEKEGKENNPGAGAEHGTKEKTAEEKEMESFMASVDEKLKLKNA